MRISTRMLTGAATVVLLSSFSLPSAGTAAETKEQDASVTGYGGAVASEDPEASAAGMEVLKKGGNAVDAAVATAAAQGVTRPYSGGIGGGGMMLIDMKDKDEPIVIDSRSISPSSFGDETYVDPETGLISSTAERISSGAAFSIPGTVKNWEEALENYGKLSMAEVLAPAINIAEEGFTADANFVRETEENADRFRLFESTTELYLDSDGGVPRAGDTVKNEDLAETYRTIAEGGSTAFYEGEVAEAMAETINRPPLVNNPDYSAVSSAWDSEQGIMEGDVTLEDFSEYETNTYDAASTSYRGYEVYGAPPSSSGGVTIGEALNIMENEDISASKTMGYHYFMEASRLAIADRREFIGDPDKTEIPTDGLLSQGYANERHQEIDDEKAMLGQIAFGNPWPYEENPEREPGSGGGERKSFSYNFEGTNGASWDKYVFHRLDRGPLSSPDDAAFTTKNNEGILALNQRKEGRGSAYGRATANMDPLDNPELSMDFQLSDLGNDQRLRIWLQGDVWRSGSSIPENGYGVEINAETSEVSLLKSQDSSFSRIDSYSYPLTTDKQNLRFAVHDNSLKVSVHEQGEQPDSWLGTHDLSKEDELRYDAGKFLLSAINFEDSSDIAITLDNIHVGEWNEESEDLSVPAETPSFRTQETPETSTTIEEEEAMIQEEQKRLEEAEEAAREADESTIHLSTSDKEGNVVSYTTTIVSIGGNGMVVPEHGFLLNNALYGRTPGEEPTHPNYPKPGMRSLSSMSPTLIRDEGEPVMTVGAPGSDTILTTVLQITMSHLDFDLSLPEAFAEPRVSQRNNFDSRADYEGNYWNEEFEAMKQEWEAMGHRFSEDTAVQGIGAATGIEFLEDGQVRPVAEAIRRGGGSAVVESESPVDEGNPNGPPEHVPGKGHDGSPDKGPPEETPGNGPPDHAGKKGNK